MGRINKLSTSRREGKRKNNLSSIFCSCFVRISSRKKSEWSNWSLFSGTTCMEEPETQLCSAEQAGAVPPTSLICIHNTHHIPYSSTTHSFVSLININGSDNWWFISDKKANFKDFALFWFFQLQKLPEQYIRHSYSVGHYFICTKKTWHPRYLHDLLYDLALQGEPRTAWVESDVLGVLQGVILGPPILNIYCCRNIALFSEFLYRRTKIKLKLKTPICIYILMSCLCTIYTWGEFSEGCFRIESDYCISDVFEGGMRKIELYWRSIFEDGLLAHVRTTSGFTICTTTLSQYAYYALDIVLPRGKRHTNHPSMASNFCGPVILLIPSVKTPAEICPSPVLLKLQIDQNYIFFVFLSYQFFSLLMFCGLCIDFLLKLLLKFNSQEQNNVFC